MALEECLNLQIKSGDGSGRSLALVLLHLRGFDDINKTLGHENADAILSQLKVSTGEVAGFEALLRWQHPEYGFVPPDGFIPMAEQTGLIRPVTAWVLEVTETATMADPKAALMCLRTLNDAGVRLSIDDFGTGYSSLSYIRKLPVHEIKIDRSFVMEMDVNKGDATIVRTIINMCHDLGYEVVAEGVENQNTCDLLLSMGCVSALFSKSSRKPR